MHGMTEKKHGLRAALRSMLGALLASSPGARGRRRRAARWCSPRPAICSSAARSTPSVPGSPMTGQMYVEYFIPKTLTHPYPIVMIHGGSQTGTNFTGTPDGREGWAQYFVRRGHAGLCGRSGGARPLGAFLAVAGQGGGRQTSSAPSSASSRRSASTCGRRPSCTRNGPAAASPATRRSTRSTPRSFPRWSISRSSSSSTATPASRCSTRSGPRCC